MPNLDQVDARGRFSSVPVARLATADGEGRPHLVVTTFVVEGDVIHMAVDHKPKRSRDLKRLRNIAANPYVCLLADHYADDWTRLWWTRADGRARIVTDPAGLAGPVGLLADRYPQYEEHPPEGPVITVAVARWSGWIYG